MVSIVLCLLGLFATDIINAAPSLREQDRLCKSKVLPKLAEEFSRYMDISVKPCDNFYQYVCGKSTVSVKEVLEESFEKFSKKFHQKRVNAISDLNDGNNKARLHYQNCMDWNTRRKRGVEPLLEYVKDVIGFDAMTQEFVEDHFDVIEASGKLGMDGNHVFFSVYYKHETITLYENLALNAFNKSDLEYMLVETGMSSTTASKIVQEVEELGAELNNLNNDSATSTMESLNFQELKSRISDIDWEKYFKTAIGHIPSQKILLYSPSFFYGLQKILDRTSPKTIANFIFVYVLSATEHLLDGRYNEIVENMANKDGKKYDPDPGYWCTLLPGHWIREAVGKAYVEEFFSGSNKIEATELVDCLKRAYVENNWFNAKIKEGISKDFANMSFEIGYPDWLLSSEVLNERYKDLEIVPGKHYESQLNVVRNFNLMILKGLSTSWVTPLPVEIIGGRYWMQIPAAQLQPPYYHHCYPKAVNYGSVGSLISEEIARIVGLSGSESFTKVPDTGSVRLAYKAYTDWIKEKRPVRNLVLPNFEGASDKQLFFIAYAHGWCGSDEPETEKMITDALSKLPEFAAVFQCPRGSNMNSETKAVLEL